MTPNFTNKELECKCGCGMLPLLDFIRKVQILRGIAGFPLPVTSGARCAAYNSKVSNTGRTGPHTTGRAIDIGVSFEKADRLLEIAYELKFFTGKGIHQKGNGTRFIHLDDLPDRPGCPRPRIWTY